MVPPIPILILRQRVMRKVIGNVSHRWQEKNEAKWLEGVVNSDHDEWLGLEEWTSKFEPAPKEESKLHKKVKGHVKNKALEKVQEGISTQLTLTCLEITSKILKTLQDKFVEKDAAPRQLLNVCNAIVLTYRFEASPKASKKEIAFLRQTAVAELCALLLEMQSKLSLVQKVLREQLTLAQDEAHAVIANRIEKLVLFPSIQPSEKVMTVQEKLHAIGQRTGVVDNDRVDGLLKKAGVERPLQRVATVADNVDDFLQTLQAFVKQGMLRQLDNVTEILSTMMDTLLVDFTRLSALAPPNTSSSNNNENEDKNSEEMEKALANTTHEMYLAVETRIQSQVSLFVEMLSGIMFQGDEAE